LVWHSAGAVGTGYYCLDLSANFYAGLSFTCFGVVSCLIEAQFLIYRKPQAMLFLKLAGFTLLFVALQFCTSLVSYLFFSAVSEEVAYALGNVCPSVLYVIGFFPQIWEFISTRDVTGYSFGVTAFDVAGCVFNCIYLYADEDPLDASKEAAPFLAIVFMHIVLIVTAVAVLGCSKRTISREQIKKAGTEDTKGELDPELNESKSSENIAI